MLLHVLSFFRCVIQRQAKNRNLYQSKVGVGTYINSALAHDGCIFTCGRTSTFSCTQTSVVTEMPVACISSGGIQKWVKRNDLGSAMASRYLSFVNVYARDIGKEILIRK